MRRNAFGCNTILEKNVALLKRMTDLNPESIRLVVVNYTSGLLNTTGTQAIKLLAVLEAFSKPCNPSEKWLQYYWLLVNYYWHLIKLIYLTIGITHEHKHKFFNSYSTSNNQSTD